MFNLFQKKPQGEHITFKIKGMHCTSCAMNIDGALEDVDGVLNSETSYAQSKVKIEYDPQKVSKRLLAQTIKDQGYVVEN